jgi:hypothetical protein
MPIDRLIVGIITDREVIFSSEEYVMENIQTKDGDFKKHDIDIDPENSRNREGQEEVGMPEVKEIMYKLPTTRPVIKEIE